MMFTRELLHVGGINKNSGGNKHIEGKAKVFPKAQLEIHKGSALNLHPC